jgi:small GTP-binding protein
MSDRTERIFKLAILGNSAVGKTSLINQYIHQKFEQDYHPSLGVNIVIKEMDVKEKNAHIKMIFWDIAGQEKYDLSRKAFFQGCVGALFVYDVTRPITFKDVESKWLKELTEFGNKNVACAKHGDNVEKAFKTLVLSVISNKEKVKA